MKRLVQRARQIVDGFDEIIVFRARPRDADGVAFLERVVADEMRRHLPGDDDERDGIAQRVGQAGDGIGGAGPGRDQHGADLAGRARITLGGMHRALFVPHQDVPHLVLLEQRVVDRQHGAAGIAENVLDALIGKRRHHHFRAGHLSHRSLRSSIFGSVSIRVIKKGLEGPWIAHRHVSRVGSSTPGGAPRYENQRRCKSTHVVCPSAAVAIFISIVAARVKQNAAAMRLGRAAANFKPRLKSERRGKTAIVNHSLSVTRRPRIRAVAALKFPSTVAELPHWGLRVLKSPIARCRFSPLEGTWLQDSACRTIAPLRRIAAGLVVALVLGRGAVAPAAAAPPPLGRRSIRPTRS